MSAPRPSTPTTTAAAWRGRALGQWQRLSLREQRLLRVLGLLLALTVLWFVGIAPAAQVLSRSSAERQALAQQEARMRAVQVQAQSLQQRARVDAPEALQQVNALAAQAGWTVQSHGALITLQIQNVAPDQLAQRLAQLRAQAHTVPSQVRLTRQGTEADLRWSGQIVLSLPDSTP